MSVLFWCYFWVSVVLFLRVLSNNTYHISTLATFPYLLRTNSSSGASNTIRFLISETFPNFFKMKVEQFRGQQYDKISRHHKKLGVPWTDPTFPANDSSIGLQKVKKRLWGRWYALSHDDYWVCLFVCRVLYVCCLSFSELHWYLEGLL